MTSEVSLELTVPDDAVQIIERAIEEVRGWPECYAESLAAWMQAAADELGSGQARRYHHPAIPFARDVLADARKACIATERLNRARR